MATVTRGQFRNELGNGVELDDPGLKDGLEGTGVSEADLQSADLDGDGVISGKGELNALFKVVDGVDHNKKSASFLDDGPAGTVYHALLGARRPPPDGAATAQAARDRASTQGSDYALSKSPTSPLANLSGNQEPGVTQPGWLKDKNKCNQFVGDALTQAGVEAPTVSMGPGKGVHYQRAETWPNRTDLFDRVTDPKDIRPGDVIVRDYPGTGTGSAHIEVVTGVNPLRTTGAHDNGAYEQDNKWLDGATYDPNTRSFTDTVGKDVYVLRPKKHGD
jgi:hypothetical protein